MANSRAEESRLVRMQRVMPKLARRRELYRELEDLGDGVVLPSDFADRRRRTMTDLDKAQSIVAGAAPRLESLRRQLEVLSTREDLLDQAERIEELHARLGSHRKAMQDRPHLEAEVKGLETDIRSLLKQIRPHLEPSDIDELRPVLAKRQRIVDLGGRQATGEAKLEQIRANLRKSESGLRAARKALEETSQPVSTEALRRAIAAARKDGDLDASVRSLDEEIEVLDAECSDQLARLSLWQGSADDFIALALPGRENIRWFEEKFGDLRQRLRRLEERREEIEREQRETSRKLDAIERAGDVPSEDALIAARSERDAVWALLRRAWVDGEDVADEARRYQGDGTLPDAFETRLAAADELSDRLRREADRVHDLASLQAAQESGRREAERLDGESDALTARMAELEAQWRASWAPSEIVPRSPREMIDWLDEVADLREKLKRLKAMRHARSHAQATRVSHIRRLDEELVRLTGSGATSQVLELVLLECESLADDRDRLRQRWEHLTADIREREFEVAALREDEQAATGELDACTARWAREMRDLGLPGETSPSEVDEFVERVRELFTRQDEAARLRTRINAIDEEAAAFNREVGAMVASIAPELSDLPANDAVVRLNKLLSEHRSRRTRQEQIKEQIEHAEQEIEDATASIRTLTARLDALCVEAQCEGPEQLEAAEHRSAHRRELNDAIAAIEREINEAGDGASLAELEAQARDVDPDTLRGRIDALRHRIEHELEPRRTELAEAKGRAEKELELMDGSDQAAALATEAQAELARIRAGSERYVRARLGARILRDQIERYRRENQGPLLRRASEYFAALTLGSFAELITDIDDSDEPVLVGVRPGRERVTVEGMSSGTRDQLYLALRLASLEKYMESAEPMPFIVDDVLVDFDDARAQAALKALAELATRTQVILFTHHSRVVEQADQLDRAVQVHAL